MGRYNVIFAGPETALRPQVREALATVAITPGLFMTLGASGFALANASTEGKVYLAQDNYLVMKGVDDDWAIGDRAIGLEMRDGQLFNARLATGQNVSVGDALTINANAELIAAGAGAYIVATAEEDYNNTSGSGQLIRVSPATGYVAS